MKLTTTFIITIFISLQSYSQVTMSYFPFQSLLAVSSNTQKTVWAECKVETNTFFSNLNTEFSLKYNFKIQQIIQYYLGAGISVNPANTFNDLSLTNGYFCDIGFRASPIKKLEAFEVVFEVSPYVNKQFEGGNLRTRLGIAYQLKRKKRKIPH